MKALLALSLLAASGGVEPIGRVGDVTLTRLAYDERAQALLAAGRPAATDDVLASLVDEVLLATEARKSRLAAGPELRDQVASARRRVAGDAFVERSLGDALDPPEAELRAAFRATADFARLQLLYYGAAEEAARSAARLREGGALAEEARRAAVARVTPRDADAPLLMRSQLPPALAEAVFGARPGAVVGPVEVPEGLAVAKVVALQPGSEEDFAARRGALLARARQRVIGPARAHVLENLRAQQKVKLDEDFLRGTDGRAPDAAQASRVVATVHGQPVRYADVLASLRSLAASGAARHVSGSQVKIDAAWREVDARLLEHASAERGYAAEPEVVERMALVERGVLAAAAFERIASGAPRRADARARAELVRKRLDALRASTAVSVDRAALERARPGTR